MSVTASAGKVLPCMAGCIVTSKLAGDHRPKKKHRMVLAAHANHYLYSLEHLLASGVQIDMPEVMWAL